MDTILQTVVDTAAIAAEQASPKGVNVWFIIALAELVLIIVLLISRNHGDDSRSELKRKVKNEGDINFGNKMNSMFNADPLYHNLIRACHPDRFAPDETRMALASDISTRITENKHDIEVLKALREEAKSKLNINI
ncbi:MAG: hypothetical protein IJ684_06670 [Bacteroidales bacterium]|nr:hypothetical protein [Bacteroidales bacterium]